MNAKAELFIDCRNDLGEGPLWHPDRGELFWFDINVGDLYRASPSGDVLDKWHFDEPHAAAGVIDRDHFLLVGSTALRRFDITNGQSEDVIPFEDDKPRTRSNDSRVNPAGGFWIGTMRRGDDGPIGSVYQFRAGEIETLLTGVDIPNSTCFSPDGRTAYFTDTPSGIIRKCPLDPDTGLPVGGWSVFADTNDLPGLPDGSVVDSEGCLWNARYGGSSVIRFTPDGRVDRTIDVPTSQVTCPALGGTDLNMMYLTTARQGMSAEALSGEPHAGSVFAIEVDVPGLPETPVRI